MHQQPAVRTFCIPDSVTGTAQSKITAGTISQRGMIGFKPPFKSARTGTHGRPWPGNSILMFTSLIAALGLRDPLDGPERGR